MQTTTTIYWFFYVPLPLTDLLYKYWHLPFKKPCQSTTPTQYDDQGCSTDYFKSIENHHNLLTM